MSEAEARELLKSHTIYEDWHEKEQLWLVSVCIGMAPITRNANKDKAVAREKAIQQFIDFKTKN